MNDRKIAVFTGTRAEYGLLRRLMGAIDAEPGMQLQVIVAGMHLSPEFGLTRREIERDGFTADASVEMLLSSDTAVGVVKSMGVGLIGIADALARLYPDLLVILGDRFEALAAAEAALVMGVPIAHLHGGETTLGAYDNAMRHAITQMATLHFTSTENYRQRVIAMGASEAYALNVGALGLDEIAEWQAVPVGLLAEELGFALTRPYFLVTYHPATAADEPPEESFLEIRNAIESFRDHDIVVTYPNADNGGRSIIKHIQAWEAAQPGRVHAAVSLGQRRYLTAMSHAAAVIGNSSSGIIEAPAFGVPTIDIGARQSGRIAGASVLHCRPRADEIAYAIGTALSASFRARARQANNPYGSGDSVPRILAALRTWLASTPTRPEAAP